jgi:hypothetical protein
VLLTEGDLDAEEEARRGRLEQPETIELVRLYYAISDPTVRHQFLELMKTAAATHEGHRLHAT